MVLPSDADLLVIKYWRVSVVSGFRNFFASCRAAHAIPPTFVGESTAVWSALSNVSTGVSLASKASGCTFASGCSHKLHAVDPIPETASICVFSRSIASGGGLVQKKLALECEVAE